MSGLNELVDEGRKRWYVVCGGGRYLHLICILWALYDWWGLGGDAGQRLGGEEGERKRKRRKDCNQSKLKSLSVLFCI